jgi:hypothetical protein
MAGNERVLLWMRDYKEKPIDCLKRSVPMAILIDFLEQQNTIIAYIKTHYTEFVGALPEPNTYTSDFLDLDRYKENCTVFFDFGSYSFAWKTNESELQELEFSVYLVVRNNTPDTLRENMLRYASAFYQLFDASNQCFDGAVDYGKITGITFFEYPEGNKNIKVAEITMTLRNEI